MHSNLWGFKAARHRVRQGEEEEALLQTMQRRRSELFSRFVEMQQECAAV